MDGFPALPSQQTCGRRVRKLSEAAQIGADFGSTSLLEALDPGVLSKHLRLFSGPPWNWGAIESVTASIRKSKPGRRCTFEIDVQTENGPHSVIGKIYAADRPDVFQAMEKLSRAGFGPHDPYSIPQPYAYLSTVHLLLQEKVDGSRAAEIFRGGDLCGSVTAAEQSARWLAQFQARAPKIGPVCDASCCLNLLRWRSQRIEELGGRLAEKAARLRQRLEKAAATLQPTDLTAGHGSFSGAHVIPAERRTVVFDWDGFDVADPARDVGRFLAALRHSAFGWLGSTRALDHAAEAFLRVYLPAVRPEVRLNLRFYEAAGCLKLAKWRPDHSVSRWYEKTAVMLDEGLRALERPEMA